SRHQKRKVPGNDLAGDTDRLTKGEAERVCRDGVHCTGHFVRKTAIIFKTTRYIGHVEFGFHDWFPAVTRLKFGKHRGVLSNFFRELKKNTAAIDGGGLRPWAGIKGGPGSFYSLVDVGRSCRSDLRDDFFGRRIVNGECFTGRAAHPLAVDVVLVRFKGNFCGAGHSYNLQMSIA